MRKGREWEDEVSMEGIEEWSFSCGVGDWDENLEFIKSCWWDIEGRKWWNVCFEKDLKVLKRMCGKYFEGYYS